MIDGFRSTNSFETNSFNLLVSEGGRIKSMPRNGGEHVVDDIIDRIAVFGGDESGKLFVVHRCILTGAVNVPWGNPELRQ